MAITKVSKGLVTDGSPEIQPEGTYRFALNAVNFGQEGELDFVSSELGNEIYTQFTPGYYPIGKTVLPNNEFVVFLANPTTSGSEIGFVNAKKVYSTLINADCLDFSITRQIQSTYKIVRGCERLILFAGEGYTPKAINIDDLSTYGSAGSWNCSEMKLFPDYVFPCIDQITINEFGGSLEAGKYFFLVQYADENKNTTSWSNESHGVNIFSDIFTNYPYGSIEGSDPAVDPPTNKSITLTLTRVDTRYTYINIGIIAVVEGVRSGYVYRDIPIGGSTKEILFTSVNNTEPYAIESFALDNIIVDEAKHIAQIDNRLLLANIKEREVDLAAFQSKALEIQTTWRTVTTRAGETTVESYSPKSANYSSQRMSLMRDEVYACGIVWYFKDGYTTPVLHIPGRAKDLYSDGTTINGGVIPDNHFRPTTVTDWDSTSVVTGIEGNYLPNVTAERWEVYNTAIRQTSTSDGETGELAYWESALDYPTTEDCDGNRIYPTGKIRHHKMPDCFVTPHFEYTGGVYYVKPLGLDFSNIEPPTGYEDLVYGYKIVIAPRNLSNQSVVDKGILTSVYQHSVDLSFCQGPGANELYWITPSGASYVRKLENFAFHGTNTKFRQLAYSPSHVKAELNFYENSIANYAGGTTFYGDHSTHVKYDYSTFVDSADTNAWTARVLPSYFYIPADSLAESIIGTEDFNNTEQQEAFILTTESAVPDPYTSIGVTPREVDYGTLGLPGTGYSAVWYVGLKKYTPSQYGDLDTLTYRAMSSCIKLYSGFTSTSQEFGGDTYISRFSFRKNLFWDDSANGVSNDISGYNPANDLWSRSLLSYYVESPILAELRMEGTGTSEVFYPKSYRNSVQEFIELEDTLSLTDLVENYYDYNEDYSALNDDKLYFPVDSTYNYCAECLGEFQNRIAYSEVAGEEARGEAFRIFLANNYRDLSANTGIITNIFVKNGKLFASTEDSLYLIPTGDSQIQTDADNVFIGNGAFFSLEPVPLKSLDSGYAGSRQKWGTINTEFGTIIIDDVRKSIYLFEQDLKDLAGFGMKRWFLDNMKLYYEEAFNELNDANETKFEWFSNPANPNGIGYHAVYDSEFKRVIITKRDYKPLFEDTYGGIRQDGVRTLGDGGKIYFNTETLEYERYTTLPPTYTPLDLSNAEYFEDKSWTISYSFLTESWVSWHSYIPLFMMSTQSSFYTYPNQDNSVSSTLYRHNYGKPLEFYSQYNQHIIELALVENIISDFVWDDVGYISTAKVKNATTGTTLEKLFNTFNKVWIYNNRQSTGIRDLVVANTHANAPFYDVLNYDIADVLVERIEKNWHINKFIDFSDQTVSEQPLSTTEWDDLQTEYFIDKLPNTAVHNTAKNQFELEPFRDKYLLVRLIQDLRGDEVASPDVQLTTKFVIPRHNRSSQ